MMPLTEGVSATVAVVTIDDVPGGNCGQVDQNYMTTSTKRLVLEASDGRRWNVFLRVPGLPANFAATNDVLELSVSAGNGLAFQVIAQTVSLSRNGNVLVFGSSASTTLLGIEPLGVAVQAVSANCTPGGCSIVDHPLRVTVGASEATLVPNETRTVGRYSLTLGRADYLNGRGVGGCDGAGVLHLGGVAVSP
jgi:hypothetical protein